MPGVRVLVVRRVRILGALLAVGAAVVCLVGAFRQWTDGLQAQGLTYERLTEKHVIKDTQLIEGPDDVARSRPGQGSSGEIAVRIRRGRAGGWELSTVYRLRLRASDPLTERLRKSPPGIATVVDVLPGGFETSHNSKLFSGSGNGHPLWCTVTQRPGSAWVTVSAERTEARSGPAEDVFLVLALSSPMTDADGHKVSWPGGSWSWSLRTPAGWAVRVLGRPDEQTDHSVVFRDVTTAGTGVILSGSTDADPAAPPGADPFGPVPADGKALITAAALLTAAVATLYGGARASTGPARGRALLWTAGLTLLPLCGTVLALVFWFSSTGLWTGPYWLRAARQYSTTAMMYDGPPGQMLLQGALLALGLFTLPLLVAYALYGPRRPGAPMLRPPLLLALPAAALPLTSVVTGGSRWVRPGLVALGAASAVAALVHLALRVWPGSPLRRWAGPAAVVTGATAAAAVCLQSLPASLVLNTTRSYDSAVLYSFGAILGSGPLTYLLLVPSAGLLVLLLHMFVPPVARLPRGALIGSVPLLITVLLPWWVTRPDGMPYGAGLFPAILSRLTGGAPGADVTLGVRVLAPALQLSWLVATVALIAHMSNCGRRAGRWAPSARASGAALLLLAAAAPVVGDPESQLPHATTAGALLAAWGGTRLLLPESRRARAERLHALSGAAHTRLTHSLARSLLYAEGRHRFLTASRGTLADASVRPEDWERTWRSLRDPTEADAARETARLRSVALGGSGGWPAWSNGVAAAVASAVLTLPWTAWPAWQGRGYSGLLEVVTVAGGTTCVWLAHGFVYGYLYPWIRGSGPVAKAGRLWAAMAPVQLLLLWPRLRLPLDQAVLTVFLLLAQTAVLALGLGLYWEVRLVHRADLLWGHVRNFRRLSSLAAPVSTVLVAAVTAAVTVLATAWADQLTTPQTPPRPAPSATATAQP
ncbi:hypothetical protein GCM10010260_71130 [Streptomyces filipinensis]|uniref:Uncharacterized protein n=1 Tax=Streptomyces filipinensis TaxID=66887 RepID=A0A918IIU4_9ACTN|nr:hypothetical protein [Streptomyces filipinensis]GGV20806.1 hypothetical protein GCM10010260_71130 [Streptomyces filipinensis]